MTREYIIQDEAVKFAIDAMTDDGREDVCVTIRGRELGNAMNNAIQHYLDSLSAELPEPAGVVDGLLRVWTPDGKDPIANGTVIFTREQLLAAIAKERAKRVLLLEAVERTVEVIQRQLDMIAERAPGKFLDKQPIVNVLKQHLRRLNQAIEASMIAPTTQEAL